MSRRDERIGLKSGWFLTVIPYSVSMPMTFGMAMRSSLPENRNPLAEGQGEDEGGSTPPSLQVLSGVDDPLDAPLLLFGLAHQRLHVDDALTLLARDLRPVVGIRGVRQVLVLLGLLADGRREVVGGDALGAAADQTLEGELFGPAHDGLDHGARGEVLEVEDFLVAIGVGDLEEAVLLGGRVHGLDGRGDHRLDRRAGVAAPRRLGDGEVRGEVLAEDVGCGTPIRALALDLHVEPSGAEDGRIDEVLAVGGADDDDVLEALDAVDLGEELGDDGGLDVGGDAGAAGAEEGVHFVEEDDDGDVLVGLLLGLLEDLTDLALGLADVLVKELGALDVEEVALDLLAALLGDLLGEVVGDGLGDHGLAAAGRAVEQHALGRRELVLLVIVGVEVGQLDGVFDGLDLVGEAADVVVADVRHFLEGEVLDIALRELLEEVPRLGVHQDVVAGLEPLRAERIGDDADLLLVGAEGDDGTLGIELFLEHDDLALDLVGGLLVEIEPLVQDQILPGLERLGLDRWVEVHLDLPTLREDVDGPVLVGGVVDAVRRGRRAELVHLFLERGDLLAGFIEGVHELLVLVERLHELAVRFPQLVLEDHEVLWRVLELLAEVDGLGLERADVGLQVLDLDFILREPAACARIGHGGGKEFREPFATRATLLVELLHSSSLLTLPRVRPLCTRLASCSKYRRLEKRKSRLAAYLPPVESLNSLHFPPSLAVPRPFRALPPPLAGLRSKFRTARPPPFPLATGGRCPRFHV